MTYNEATIIYSTARNKIKGKPLGNNLRLFKWGNNSYAIRFHQTYILIINKDGSYEYNNDGCFTVSTKKYLNKYGPLKIFQKNYAWFYKSRITNVVVPYVNGIITY